MGTLQRMLKNDIRTQVRSAKERDLEQKRGQIAQSIRKQNCYRQAEAVFVTPGSRLTQVRMNALTDGKTLLCPGPGMREGFYLLRPFSLPFRKLTYAISTKGLQEYGTPVNCAANLAGLSVGLLIGDCLALDADGLMIGDGNGFFDLSYAILNTWNVLADRREVIAVVSRKDVLDVKVEADKWDSFADRAVCEDGVIEFPGGGMHRASPEIYWQELSEKRIRKISPLWKLKSS